MSDTNTMEARPAGSQARRIKAPPVDSHTDLLDLYWREIKDNPPLTRKQEVALFKRVRAGDEAAVNELVEANLRFVVSVAREFSQNDGPTLMDLIAEGNMGLLRAIQTFDETRGFKFITYAVWWIRQAMRRMLHAQHKAARVPPSHLQDLQMLEREAGALGQQLGRSPTIDELVAQVDLAPERVSNAMAAAQRDMSLDAPVSDDQETSLLALLADPENGTTAIEEEALMETLRESLQVLNRRELQIVEWYFGLNGAKARTLEEIGQELDVTRERVRQLRNRALGKMREHYGEQLLELSAN